MLEWCRYQSNALCFSCRNKLISNMTRVGKSSSEHCCLIQLTKMPYSYIYLLCNNVYQYKQRCSTLALAGHVRSPVVRIFCFRIRTNATVRLTGVFRRYPIPCTVGQRGATLIQEWRERPVTHTDPRTNFHDRYWLPLACSWRNWVFFRCAEQ